MTKKEMLGQMEELRSTCVDICTNLWNNPESGGNEQKSADMIRELLHHEGFVIVMKNIFHMRFMQNMEVANR